MTVDLSRLPKVPVRPTPADQAPMLRQITATTDLTGLAQQLNREPFTPGVPISPAYPEKTEPRRWDYDPGYNIPLQPRTWEPIGFATLRSLAEGSDIASICIERNIDDFRELDWEIRPQVVKGMSRKEAIARASKLEDTIGEVTGFWKTPDQQHSWGSWVHSYLDDLYKTDGACLYLRKTQDGKSLYAVETVSGDTIAPIIDEQGRLPEPPQPAFRQVIRGVTWTMYARDLELPPHQRKYNFDRSLMLYEPFWSRVRSPYGHPPMETVILTINRVLNRQMLDYQLFANGTIPFGAYKVPETWSGTEIKDLQNLWDQIQANAQARSRLQFLPGGTGTGFEGMFKDPTSEAEEWLLHLIYAAYKRSPMADGFLKTGSGQGGASGAGKVAESQVGQANRALRSLVNHVSGQINRIIAANWTPDAVMVFPAFADQAEDSLMKAQVHTLYIDKGVLTRSEVREELDLDPLIEDDQLTVTTGQGIEPVEQALEPPAPIPAALSPFAKPTPPAPPPGGEAPPTPSAAPGEQTDEKAPEDGDVGKSVDYKGDLAKTARRYLLRSYPERDLGWVDDAKWEYEKHQPLEQLDMARRPGGRDPSKVDAITETLEAGASMEPIIACDFGDPKLNIADGWHRTLAAQKAGLDDVPALIARKLDPKWRSVIEGRMQDDSHEVGKALDLRRWKTRSLKSVKTGGPAAVRFTPDALTDDEAAGIWSELVAARTADDVRKVFGKAGATAAPLAQPQSNGASGQPSAASSKRSGAVSYRGWGMQ